jgi:hypothetical protein
VFYFIFVLTRFRVRGRHRGLPVGVERAVTLPRELNMNKEEKAPVNNANIDGTTAMPA